MRAGELGGSLERGGAGLALLLAVLGGCSGSDRQALELVSRDPFGNAESLVAGGGASRTLGYTAARVGAPPTLRLVRHEASSPDVTVHLGDFSFLSGGSITRLVVTDEAAAVVVGGTAWIVDPANLAVPFESLGVLGTPSDLAVDGRWVLAVDGNDLVLVNRDDLVSVVRYPAASAPTALLATQGLFLAFTGQGYVAVDPSGSTPTFNEVNDPELGNVRAAFADGASAVVGGPAATLNHSRVLRLDLSTPAAPVVVKRVELAGAFVALAWDGGATGVVAVHGAADGGDPRAFHMGYVVREEAGAFRGESVSLAFWSQSDQPLAAHGGRLFAAQATGVALLGLR